MNFSRFRTGLGLVAFFALATAGASIAQNSVNPNAPPPPPLPNSNPAAAQTTAPQALTVPASATPSLAPNAVQSAVVPAGVGSPTPAPGPKRGRKAAAKGTPAPDATDTPEAPQFSTLDGIWEIELQPLGHRLANYQHFSIKQSGSTLTGYWEHDPKKMRTPISGTFDGRLIQISATTDGGTVTFAGYVESYGDMVGMQHLTDRDTGVAFTAQHRKKEHA